MSTLIESTVLPNRFVNEKLVAVYRSIRKQVSFVFAYSRFTFYPLYLQENIKKCLPPSYFFIRILFYLPYVFLGGEIPQKKIGYY